MLAVLERGLLGGVDLCSSEFAASLDGAAGDVCLRSAFHVPRGAAGARYRRPDDDAVYLCGHSLGLAPVRAAGAVAAEMNLWAARGVDGHFESGAAPGSGAWASAEDAVVRKRTQQWRARLDDTRGALALVCACGARPLTRRAARRACPRSAGTRHGRAGGRRAGRGGRDVDADGELARAACALLPAGGRAHAHLARGARLSVGPLCRAQPGGHARPGCVRHRHCAGAARRRGLPAPS